MAAPHNKHHQLIVPATKFILLANECGEIQSNWMYFMRFFFELIQLMNNRLANTYRAENKTTKQRNIPFQLFMGTLYIHKIKINWKISNFNWFVDAHTANIYDKLIENGNMQQSFRFKK